MENKTRYCLLKNENELVCRNMNYSGYWKHELCLKELQFFLRVWSLMTTIFFCNASFSNVLFQKEYDNHVISYTQDYDIKPYARVKKAQVVMQYDHNYWFIQNFSMTRHCWASQKTLGL